MNLLNGNKLLILNIKNKKMKLKKIIIILKNK